ncbi:tripartite tricarboxylate transporter substrate binding protein [Rhizobium wenxiniae]|uniref:Bug family tripartite tricarboxylate transporter substrate binding protein n=1 Tax=Rhizobium wenxiniae TaxID=1737357 RepID=UPI001C6EBDA5|nr:tripartite tricarboxylate transporter substrate binding protein [Rhizobium wenxiniae]MBW9088146.1 tripartite tricarboxylate transporter substrate binding protein [Rhizobium wenxiniae]
MKRFYFAAAVALASTSSFPAQAADWKPTGTVTLIVPSTPGGGHDTNARALARVMEKHAGQSIVIVNQPAGGGVVAYNEMMKAKTDGQTLGQVSTSLVTDKYRLDNVRYDGSSFTYVGEISEDPNLLVVSAKGPLAELDIKGLIEKAKTEPETINIGVSGNWGNQDYVRFALEEATGAKFRRIPIKGGRQILLGLLSGDIGIGLLYPSEVKAQVDSGELKVIAHNGEIAPEGFGNVPSFKESGIDVGLSVWRALVLPKETPAEIASGWERILADTMKDPALKEAYKSVSIGYAYKDTAETEALVKESSETLTTLSKKAGLIK